MNEAETWQRKVALATSGGVCEVCGKTLTTSTWQGASFRKHKAKQSQVGKLRNRPPAQHSDCLQP